MTDHDLICAFAGAVGEALASIAAEIRMLDSAPPGRVSFRTAAWGLERARELLEAELAPLWPALAEVECTEVPDGG